MKNLEINTEYIELNKVLKIMQWVETGGQANQCIEDGFVQVNGQTEYRKRNKLRPGDVVEFNGEERVKITALSLL